MQIKQFSRKDHYVRALIYGASGTGKTHFAGTAAHRAIFASAENGLLTIADKKPLYVDIKSMKDLRDFLTYLKSPEFVKARTEGNMKAVDTVVIDSISEINEVCKREIEKRIRRKMQIQDWGDLAAEIEEIVQELRTMPFHVLIIAQEKIENDEQKIHKIVPMLNKSGSTKLPYFMDFVAYMQITKEGERELIVGGDYRLVTKSRDALITNDTDMSFDAWINAVAGTEIGEEKVEVEYMPPELKAPVRAAPEDTKGSEKQRTKIHTLWNLLVDRGLIEKDKSEAVRREWMKQIFNGKTSTLDLTSAECNLMIKSIEQRLEKDDMKKFELPFYTESDITKQMAGAKDGNDALVIRQDLEAINAQSRAKYPELKSKKETEEKIKELEAEQGAPDEDAPAEEVKDRSVTNPETGEVTTPIDDKTPPEEAAADGTKAPKKKKGRSVAQMEQDLGLGKTEAVA